MIQIFLKIRDKLRLCAGDSDLTAIRKHVASIQSLLDQAQSLALRTCPTSLIPEICDVAHKHMYESIDYSLGTTELASRAQLYRQLTLVDLIVDGVLAGLSYEHTDCS